MFNRIPKIVLSVIETKPTIRPPHTKEIAMAMNFHETLTSEDLPLPSPRSTGLVFAVAALILAVLFRNNTVILFAAMSASAALATISFAKPDLLEPLNRAWFKFGLLLSKVVNPIVMFLLFVAILPFGIIMQLMRDPLQRARKQDDESYWIPHAKDMTSRSMTNQF